MGTRINSLKVLLALTAVLLTAVVRGQDSLTMPAAGADFISSGNGHGGFIRVFGGIERKRHLFVAGPMIQLANGKINGGRFTYSRNVSAAPERSRPDAKGRYFYDFVQINLGAHLQYVHQAPLSDYVIGEEETISRDSTRTFDQVRLSTLEIGGGIELRLNITRNFTWFNMVALSTHLHTQYNETISRSRSAVTLGLSTGLLFVFY